MAHLFILLSCKIDIVCVWISNMDSIEICFQGFTNDVVGLNESIFYCAEMNLKKDWALESVLFMFVFSLSYDIRRSYVFLAIGYRELEKRNIRGSITLVICRYVGCPIEKRGFETFIELLH